MHAGSRCDWLCSQVDDEVSNLAKKIILVGILTDATREIRIRVKNGDSYKGWSSLDRRQGDGIPYELGVVQLHYWLADKIGSWREINDRRSCSRRITAHTTPSTIGNCFIDGVGIIGFAVTCIVIN